MIPWIESHTNLSTHRKTMTLKEISGVKSIAEVVGRLTCMWHWAANNAPDGDVTVLNDYQFGTVCGLYADKNVTRASQNGAKWKQACIDAGFLEWLECDDGSMKLVIHDWYIYIGKVSEAAEKRRASGAARQQRYRDKMSRVTQASRNASTQENPTQENPTQQDNTSPLTPQTRGTGEREGSPSGEVSVRWGAPTVSEVRAYAALTGMQVDAEAFVKANEANGWKDSRGDHIRNWKLWLQGTALKRAGSDPTAPDPRVVALEELKRKYAKEDGNE